MAKSTSKTASKKTPAKPAAKKAAVKPQAKASPTSAPATDELQGKSAPAFKLSQAGGGTVSLKDFKGQNLVLYFYPKADTEGCTKEAMDFTRLKAQFAKAKTAILGVSADPVPALEKFAAKHKLTIPLLSDADDSHAMLAAYAAWGQKSMYGKTFMGVIRKTFLIDSAGKIARIWPKVSVPGHADEVLEAARALPTL